MYFAYWNICKLLTDDTCVSVTPKINLVWNTLRCYLMCKIYQFCINLGLLFGNYSSDLRHRDWMLCEHSHPGGLSCLVHGKSSMIMDFSTHCFYFHGKSWMAHGRAWLHGSSSMILTHDSSMLSHVEDFVQSENFLLPCQFWSFVLSLYSEGYLNGPGSIKAAFWHRVSWSREIGKILVSIGWAFDDFRQNCGKTRLFRSILEKM